MSFDIEGSWLVGLDLEHHADGALAFARGLAEHVSAARFVGVHVMEVHPAAVSTPTPEAEAMLEAATTTARGIAGAGVMADVRVLLATSAEDGLEAAVEQLGVRAMIIGRLASSAGASGMVRLGRVARHFVRRLPVPVLVVPPDLTELRAGPVVVAVEPEDHCVPAVEAGSALARALGTRCVLLHVVRLPEASATYLPPDAWASANAELVELSRADLRAWAERHGLPAAEVQIEQGPVATTLLDAAAKAGASVIVAGSRKLSTLERIFMGSISTELAASSATPVAIVPGS